MLSGVGRTRYESRWSLPVTVQDAAEVRNVLVDPDVCAYLTEHVRLLHDETASIIYILDGMKWLAGQARSHPDATIVGYFPGHGWRQPDGRYALIPSDVKPDDLQNSVLWAEEFTNALRDIKSRRLLVLIDACHGEGMATAKGEETLMPAGFAKTPWQW